MQRIVSYNPIKLAICKPHVPHRHQLERQSRLFPLGEFNTSRRNVDSDNPQSLVGKNTTDVATWPAARIAHT